MDPLITPDGAWQWTGTGWVSRDQQPAPQVSVAQVPASPAFDAVLAGSPTSSAPNQRALSAFLAITALYVGVALLVGSIVHDQNFMGPEYYYDGSLDYEGWRTTHYEAFCNLIGFGVVAPVYLYQLLYRVTRSYNRAAAETGRTLFWVSYQAVMAERRHRRRQAQQKDADMKHMAQHLAQAQADEQQRRGGLYSPVRH